MNLTIDKGNTQTKVGLFDDNGELLRVERYSVFDCDAAQGLLDEYNVDKAIVSSVVGDEDAVYSFLKEKLDHFLVLDDKTPIPLENLYKTPSTLGRDRIAACVGANWMKPDENLLVIDAGTAVTYDVVNARNQYVGGNISLGIDMRRKALHTFTSKLPLIEVEEDVPLIGDTTKNALLSGVVEGLTFEIDGYIDAMSEIYPHLNVFLTGGSAIFLQSRIKNRTFAVQNLLLIGLNRILNFR